MTIVWWLKSLRSQWLRRKIIMRCVRQLCPMTHFWAISTSQEFVEKNVSHINNFYRVGCKPKTSIYADADGPRDAASRPIDHIVLLRAGRRVWSHGNNRRSILKTLCYTYRQLSVVSTYVHGEALTPLGRFAVDILHRQVRNKYATNRTDRAWALMYSITSVYRSRCEQQRLTVDDIVYLN